MQTNEYPHIFLFRVYIYFGITHSLILTGVGFTEKTRRVLKGKLNYIFPPINLDFHMHTLINL
jgi:hypothetical protein